MAVEATHEIVEVERRHLAMAVEVQREVVEVADTDPQVVQLVEPVVIGAVEGADGILTTSDIGTRVPALIDGLVPLTQLPPIAFDMLSDVEAAPGTEGLLERQDDGQIRPVTRDAVLAPHIIDDTPHPAYDDTFDLTLLFNNGLV
jgi:hypothetical protein